MIIRIIPLAARALGLERDGVFRLLVVMTMLLGWVVALGVAGTVLMHEVYGVWRLERSAVVQVYLAHDTDEAALQALQVEVARLPGVVGLARVPEATLVETLKPYGGDVQGLPWPQVLDIRTSPAFDRTLLEPLVLARFPAAEIDDARPMLQAVQQGVRVIQTVGAVLALVMVAVMGLVVALIVQAGLRARHETIQLLQHIGATQSLLSALVGRLVVVRAVWGWVWASLAATGVMLGVMLAWPEVAPYVSWPVWVALAVSPAILPIMAWFAAVKVVKRMMSNPVKMQG